MWEVTALKPYRNNEEQISDVKWSNDEAGEWAWNFELLFYGRQYTFCVNGQSCLGAHHETSKQHEETNGVHWTATGRREFDVFSSAIFNAPQAVSFCGTTHPCTWVNLGYVRGHCETRNTQQFKYFRSICLKDAVMSWTQHCVSNKQNEIGFRNKSKNHLVTIAFHSTLLKFFSFLGKLQTAFTQTAAKKFITVLFFKVYLVIG